MIDTWSEYAVMIIVQISIGGILGLTQHDTWNGVLISTIIALVAVFGILAGTGKAVWPVGF